MKKKNVFGYYQNCDFDWIYDIDSVREKLIEACAEETPEGFEIMETEMSKHEFTSSIKKSKYGKYDF